MWAALLVSAAGSVTAPAGAADVVGSGWWTSSPVPVAPDAPEDALVVQGGPDEPFSYAAVEFLLAGDAPTVLRLTVTPGSASSPGAELVACLLVDELEPAQGGPAADAPAYDCTTRVPGTSDGTGYRFPVDGLGDDGRLALAILPVAPTDRVVLDAPDAGALETASAASPTDGGAGAPTGGGGAATPGITDLGSSPSFGGAGGAVPSSPGFTPPAPVGGAAPVPSASSTSDGAAGGGGSQAPAQDDGLAAPTSIASVDQGADPLAVILFLVLAGVAGGLWFAAGRAGPDAEVAALAA